MSGLVLFQIFKARICAGVPVVVIVFAPLSTECMLQLGNGFCLRLTADRAGKRLFTRSSIGRLSGYCAGIPDVRRLIRFQIGIPCVGAGMPVLVFIFAPNIAVMVFQLGNGLCFLILTRCAGVGLHASGIIGRLGRDDAIIKAVSGLVLDFGTLSAFGPVAAFILF